MLVRTRDDRGRRCRVPLRDIVLGGTSAHYASMIARDASRGCLRMVEHAAHCAVAAAAGLAGLVAVTVVWWAIPALPIPAPLATAGAVALWGGGLLLPVVWVFCALEARRHVRVVKTFGACPACAYPLTDLASAPDGCTICPECGAAWRIPAT